LAAALVESFQLGKHEGTDVLGIGFSSPDLIGHAFGPRSHEVQDTYAHLDRTIGALLDRLDALVGRDRYIVALTADHGVAPIPEQQTAEGKDAGRLSASAIVDAVEQRIRLPLGDGKHVLRLNGNDLYFEPGVYAKLQGLPATLDAAVAAIGAVPGVARVFRSEEVRDAAASHDPLLRAAALSYFPGRSGDLILVPKPGWMLAATGTTHGGASADDQRVPIVFMGKGVAPGHYQQPATPADIAPTLAVLSGISMPKPEGHALLKPSASDKKGHASP
jgi:predicted AlkP superfamily pyrophosphatase or phosphodiesterase